MEWQVRTVCDYVRLNSVRAGLLKSRSHGTAAFAEEVKKFVLIGDQLNGFSWLALTDCLPNGSLFRKSQLISTNGSDKTQNAAQVRHPPLRCSDRERLFSNQRGRACKISRDAD